MTGQVVHTREVSSGSASEVRKDSKDHTVYSPATQTSQHIFLPGKCSDSTVSILQDVKTRSLGLLHSSQIYFSSSP